MKTAHCFEELSVENLTKNFQKQTTKTNLNSDQYKWESWIARTCFIPYFENETRCWQVTKWFRKVIKIESAATINAFTNASAICWQNWWTSLNLYLTSKNWSICTYLNNCQSLIENCWFKGYLLWFMCLQQKQNMPIRHKNEIKFLMAFVLHLIDRRVGRKNPIWHLFKFLAIWNNMLFNLS